MEPIWPVCPQPLPLECLTNWLYRVAATYRLTVPQLLESIGASTLVASDDDQCASSQLLDHLRRYSGLSLARLKRMTLAGYVRPIGLAAKTPADTDWYAHYIHGFRVLPLVQDAGESNIKTPRLPWARLMHQRIETFAERTHLPVCPKCLAEDEIPYIRLTWMHGLVTSCPWHQVLLTPQKNFRYEMLKGDLEIAEPLSEGCRALLKLDQMTTEALRHGFIDLPNGCAVSGAWWLRFLRAFLDELARGEEHHRWGFQCLDIYKAIWNAVDQQPPTRTKPEFTIENTVSNYRTPLFRAAAVGVEMVLYGELTPPENSRARFLAPL